MSEIESLSLQKFVIAATMGFSSVPSPLFMLLLVMVVVVPIVATIQE
jgi:hypothetical protein